MESDVTQSAAFYKAWAWAETHKKHLLMGTAVIIAVGCAVGFFVWQQNEKQVEASKALSKAAMQSSTTGQPAAAETFQEIARAYAGTGGGERALLIAGARFFAEGKYTEAQGSFQKFLADYSGSDFAGQAALGVAASLEAQGKTDEALKAYKEITERRTTDTVMPLAKLSLARLYEAQGNLAQARDTYEQLARSNFGPLGQEAGMHLQNLLTKNPELTQSQSAPTNAPASTITTTNRSN